MLRNGDTSPAGWADHVIPISRGGANTVANIQLLCGAGSRAKGAKLR